MALLANAHFKRGGRFTPDEFMPFTPRARPEAPRDLHHRLDAALTAWQARRDAAKGGA